MISLSRQTLYTYYEYLFILSLKTLSHNSLRGFNTITCWETVHIELQIDLRLINPFLIHLNWHTTFSEEQDIKQYQKQINLFVPN